MKPAVPSVLAGIAALIRDDAVPALGDGYAGEQLQRALPLLQAAGEEFDRAAARRVEEIRALCALFARAVPVLDDPVLARALGVAAGAAGKLDGDALRVSSLDATLEPLRALLIELHAWSESSASPQAAEVNRAVWAELRAASARRRSSIDRF
jgi:hypothetical protein